MMVAHVVPAPANVVPTPAHVVPAQAGTQSPLARLPDWEARLMRAVETAPAFGWAVSDCCRFAARCVEAITGVDPMDGCFNGHYTGAMSAARVIAAHGGLPAALDLVLGAPLERLSLAGRGDVVLAALGHEHDGGARCMYQAGGLENLPGSPLERFTVAVCVGDRLAAQGLAGVVYLPLSAGVRAWRI